MPARAPYPYPPFRMKAPEAARYCGMSESAFFRAVQMGELPRGQRRIGGTYWLRDDLEAAMVEAETAEIIDFSQRI